MEATAAEASAAISRPVGSSRNPVPPRAVMSRLLDNSHKPGVSAAVSCLLGISRKVQVREERSRPLGSSRHSEARCARSCSLGIWRTPIGMDNSLLAICAVDTDARVTGVGMF